MKRISLIGLLIFTLPFCAAAVDKAPIPEDAPVKTIEMTAEKFHFTPEKITVEQGTHVILKIESLDVDHGFKSKKLGIKDTTIPAKEKTTVEFYAEKPGKYHFHCSNFCGLGHFFMGGKIIIEEKDEGEE